MHLTSFLTPVVSHPNSLPRSLLKQSESPFFYLSLPPVYLQNLFYFPFQGNLCSTPRVLIVIEPIWVNCVVSWLFFIQQLISVYKWVCIMFVFGGLGCLSHNDFLLVPTICLGISWCHIFNNQIVFHYVNSSYFLYSILLWETSRLFLVFVYFE